MNKKRFGSLPMKCWAMVLGLLVVTAAYTTLTEAPTIMAAVTTRELPVYNVDTQDKVLAISFDAAWGSANTEGILDILDEYDIKTNFFLVGFWAEKYPELVAELVARGHEVGNHSATHPHMSQLSAPQIREELRRCSDLIESITGKPTTLFRPPYGEYNNDVVRISREEGYECIQWNVDSIDWKNLGADDIVRRCTQSVHPGDIVLFHNDSKYILQALPRVLEYYKQQGYKVIPISELLLKGNTWIDHAGTQHLATSAPQAAASATPAQ